METTTPPDGSPWHAGERQLHQALGVADRMARFGPKVIRDFLPDQHREFYPRLPFLVLGTVDASGSPWATVLEGPPGFLSSPDPGTLQVAALPGPGDPAAGTLAAGAAVGLLGIELHTRRRNRLNGRVVTRDHQSFAVRVDQAFGNCPQYIQTRAFSFADQPAGPGETDTRLNRADRALIAAADTFFIASYVDEAGEPARRAVDVSHRGGRPGFVRLDNDVLTVPDFAGNLHFNTLGNLLVNPRAGLLFIDFATGDLLHLTGTTELVLEGSEVAAFPGAERLWRLQVRQVVRRPRALALRWAFGEFSPRSLATGTWQPAG